MWLHMHTVHTPVHPLNYSFNVYQIIAVNSLYAPLWSICYTQSQHTKLTLTCTYTSNACMY